MEERVSVYENKIAFPPKKPRAARRGRRKALWNERVDETRLKNKWNRRRRAVDEKSRG